MEACWEDIDVYEDQEIIDALVLVIRARYLEQIADILLAPDDTEHHSVAVEFPIITDINNRLASLLVGYPLRVLPLFDAAARDVQATLLADHPARASMVLKTNVHVRLVDIPLCAEITRFRLPRSHDVSRLLSVKVTVVRTGTVKMFEYQRDFACLECKTVFPIKADFEQNSSIVKPTRCPGNADDGSPCQSTKFRDTVADNGGTPAFCSDYQEIKIQEQVQRLAMGTIPRSMHVILEHDLVDTCKPGDDVTITGVLMRRWRPCVTEAPCDIELVLVANQVEVSNNQKEGVNVTDEMKDEFIQYWKDYRDRPLVGRNNIVMSFCPQVYGMYIVKLAVLMALIGGVQHIDQSGLRIRGESHLLLVGDPGTGKSQFLKYAAKCVSRSVLTTGVGTTSAGLTVAAVKDGAEWQLEAGALVLADGGLCCIDEFASVREHDRATIHEAMEQQTISVAKAGLVCKLQTRTTVLASTNPKGKYDPGADLSVNTAIASPLLSRFDLVLVLLDTRNEEWDRALSAFILEGKDVAQVQPEAKFALDKMKAYISVAKTLQPQLTRASEKILIKYYQLQRQQDHRNAARTTIRLLESMVRLAQAHARLMFHEDVTVMDAVVAVTLMETSMQGSSLMGEADALHAPFPLDPDEHHHTQELLVLERLGLDEMLEADPLQERLPICLTQRHTSRRAKILTGNDRQGAQGKQKGSSSSELDTNEPEPQNRSNIKTGSPCPGRGRKRKSEIRDGCLTRGSDMNRDRRRSGTDSSGSSIGSDAEGNGTKYTQTQQPAPARQENSIRPPQRESGDTNKASVVHSPPGPRNPFGVLLLGGQRSAPRPASPVAKTATLRLRQFAYISPTDKDGTTPDPPAPKQRALPSALGDISQEDAGDLDHDFSWSSTPNYHQLLQNSGKIPSQRPATGQS